MILQGLQNQFSLLQMSFITIIVSLVLGLIALLCVNTLRRFLIPVGFFLAAYSVSGRLLWLVAAVLLGVVVVLQKRLHQKRRRDALLALAPINATSEQRDAFRQQVPEYAKIKDAWIFTSLLYPTPWEKERETIANYLCLAPPPESQTAFRDGLNGQEHLLLVMAEGGSKKRLSQPLAEALIEHAHKHGSKQRAERKREMEKDDKRVDPILFDAAPVVKGGMEVIFELSAPTELICAGEENLILLSAGEYAGHLSLKHQPPPDDADWPVSELACTFDFECEGQRFACETKVNELEIAGLEAPEFCEKGIPWADAPAGWRQAFEQRCMASDVQVCDDARSRFELMLDGVKHIIMTKYCHYRFDLAVMEDRRDILIRIHGLLAEQWVDDPQQPGEQNFSGHYPVPPFCVILPAARILPFAGPRIHLVSDAEDWDDDRPVVFRRMG